MSCTHCRKGGGQFSCDHNIQQITMSSPRHYEPRDVMLRLNPVFSNSAQERDLWKTTTSKDLKRVGIEIGEALLKCRCLDAERIETGVRQALVTITDSMLRPIFDDIQAKAKDPDDITQNHNEMVVAVLGAMYPHQVAPWAHAIGESLRRGLVETAEFIVHGLFVRALDKETVELELRDCWMSEVVSKLFGPRKIPRSADVVKYLLHESPNIVCWDTVILTEMYTILLAENLLGASDIRWLWTKHVQPMAEDASWLCSLLMQGPVDRDLVRLLWEEGGVRGVFANGFPTSCLLRARKLGLTAHERFLSSRDLPDASWTVLFDELDVETASLVGRDEEESTTTTSSRSLDSFAKDVEIGDAVVGRIVKRLMEMLTRPGDADPGAFYRALLEFEWKREEDQLAVLTDDGTRRLLRSLVQEISKAIELPGEPCFHDDCLLVEALRFAEPYFRSRPYELANAVAHYVDLCLPALRQLKAFMLETTGNSAIASDLNLTEKSLMNGVLRIGYPTVPFHDIRGWGNLDIIRELVQMGVSCNRAIPIRLGPPRYEARVMSAATWAREHGKNRLLAFLESEGTLNTITQSQADHETWVWKTDVGQALLGFSRLA